MKARIRSLIFCLVLSICYLMPVSAHAHKVNIYAYAEDGMIHSESYFVDGTKCKNSLIEVFDERAGTRLLEGKTDENGKFSFKIPKVTSLKLVLHASMGHQNEYTLSEDEVREAMGEGQRPQGARQSKETKTGKETSKSSSQPERVSTKSRGKMDREVTDIGRGMSESEMEALMERVIDRKLKPVIGMLVKLRENNEKPGFTEIVGGIGYIVGLMGVAMYLKRRFKERN
ncbi:MAG: hypothetical protein QMD03_00555 [Syntrophales bacterium]|nr:hypothetical protein [Syntrophales bacterium]